MPACSTAPRSPSDAPIRIGVSACLLGRAVRYDGGHKRDGFLVDILGPFVEWVPVCPEVEIGLGTPRPTLRLERDGDTVRLVMLKTGADHTAAMRRYAQSRTARLASDDLCGYILKKDSPSCGMERVKLYDAQGTTRRCGRGVFADALMRRFPNLPVEEEGRLNDPHLRENFVERVFAYRRVRSLFAARWTLGDLVAFHSMHKLQLMAHAPKAYVDLGLLVAGAKAMTRVAVRDGYTSRFMNALRVIATPGRHANVLQHAAGYVKKRLDDDARRELLAVIEDYRIGLLPLVVPITLIRHHLRRFHVAYLEQQVYFAPHPKELMLRNHV